MLQKLLEEEAKVETYWQNVNETFTPTSQKVMGPKTHKQKEWISADALRKIHGRKQKKTTVNNSQTRAAKARAEEDFTKANREVKISAKADKQTYVIS